MKDTRLVIFDWDGTLMDSVGLIVESLQKASQMRQLEQHDTHVYRDVIGLGMREAVHALYPHDKSDEFVNSFTEAYREFYFAPDAKQELFAGTVELLSHLRDKDCLLAVATGKSRHGLDIALEKSGLQAYFHITRCADETCSKPDPLMLNQILEETGIQPHEAVMVGDTEYDLAMAGSAGVHGIGVTWGVHEPERLQKHNPVACADTVAELQALFS